MGIPKTNLNKTQFTHNEYACFRYFSKNYTSNLKDNSSTRQKILKYSTKSFLKWYNYHVLYHFF